MGAVVPIRPPLTRADIIGQPTATAAHIDMTRSTSMWMYTIAGLPRLAIHDYSERGRGTTRVFLVDEKPVRDLDCALAVLNGTMTLEDAMPQEEDQAAVKPPEPPRKISIDQQIEEVKYELAQRSRVYPRLVSKGSLRQAEADYHVARMEGILRTLEWCRDNRDLITAVHAQAKAASAPTSNDQPEGAAEGK